MLYTETVEPSTLGLLRQLIEIPELKDFALTGGTNLSLKLGHRMSIDLDLFTLKPFNEEKIYKSIEINFPSVRKLDEDVNTLLLSIEGVKVDLIAHQYPLINEFEVIENIRLYSIQDVISMKLSAIARRGAKKDFWDIAALLDIFSVKELLACYQAKFPKSDIGMVVRSLLYFSDAEHQELPITLFKTTWNEVKNKIEKAVNVYVSESI